MKRFWSIKGALKEAERARKAGKRVWIYPNAEPGILWGFWVLVVEE